MFNLEPRQAIMLDTFSKIQFRPLQTDDMPLMVRWLNTAHVAHWWAGERELAAITTKFTGYLHASSPIHGYIILNEAVPIGYIQTYAIADNPAYAPYIGAADGAAGIEMFIGEANYLHRGLGEASLRQFLKEIVFAQRSVSSCIIGSEPSNIGAIRAYENAGLTFWKIAQLPDWHTPAILMHIQRPT